MFKKCISLCALVALSALVFAGCSSDEVVDEYAQVTVRQATYGPPVISKGFKYKFVKPEIVEAAGHLCLIREGNVTTMVAGRSIADKIESMDKSDITFNVVKNFSPYVHFMAEQVVSGTDTVFVSQAGNIALPYIRDAETFDSDDYDETALARFRFNDSQGLRRMVDERYAVKGKIALVEEDGDPVWMLEAGRGSKLRVTNPDDTVLMVLRMVTEKGMDFDGGITFTEVEEWADRRNNQVCGTVTIDWLKYAGKVFSVL